MRTKGARICAAGLSGRDDALVRAVVADTPAWTLVTPRADGSPPPLDPGLLVTPWTPGGAAAWQNLPASVPILWITSANDLARAEDELRAASSGTGETDDTNPTARGSLRAWDVLDSDTLAPRTLRRHFERWLQWQELLLRATSTEEMYRDVVEEAPDAIVSLDENGVIRSFNHAAESLSGWSAASVVGQTVASLPFLDDEGVRIALAGFDAVVTGARREAFEIPLKARDGRRRTLEVRARLVRRPHGQTRMQVVLRDITERARVANSLRQSEERFRRLAEASFEGIALYENGRIYDVNEQAARMFGCTLDQVRGRSPMDFIAPEHRASVLPQLQDNQAARILTVGWRADCSTFPIEVVLRPMDPPFAHLAVAVMRDLTETNQIAEELANAKVLVENSPVMLFRWAAEPGAPVLYASDNVRLLGLDAEQLVQNRTPWTSLVHPEDLDRAVESLDAAIRSGERRVQLEYRLLSPSKGVRWVEDRTALVTDPASGITHHEGVVLDITARKEAEETIRQLAFFDALTGLPNRALFLDRLDTAIRLAQRDHELIGVLFLDLDRFKHVNDSLGHSVGDALLRAVADRIRDLVRPSDTVGRLGGDEFVILLARTQSVDDCVDVASRIMHGLRRPFVIEGHTLFVTASIGVSVWPDDGEDVEALIKHADTAMYRAKDEGRNQVQIYERAMSDRARARLSMENDLRASIDRNDFLVHYQPQIDVRSGHIIGAEALVRWAHPDRGLVAAHHFIPLAEETGLIIPLGEQVLRQACEQLRTWHDAGLTHLHIAVNISARQFRSDQLVPLIERLLDETRLPPASLELELTETTVMHEPEVAADKLARLKALGVRLSIDDFGTGYSSLAYLRTFPIDTIKIDQSFVRDVASNPSDAAITRAVIGLSRSLDLLVVAEGVETAAQLDFLRSERCDRVQGFLFAQPLGPDDFFGILSEHTKLRT